MQSCSAGGRESPFLMDSGLPEISSKATKPTCSKGLTVLLEITFQRLSPKMCLDYFKSQLQACHRYICLNILISHFSDFWGELGVKTCQGGVWAELYPRWLHVWETLQVGLICRHCSLGFLTCISFSQSSILILKN